MIILKFKYVFIDKNYYSKINLNTIQSEIKQFKLIKMTLFKLFW